MWVTVVQKSKNGCSLTELARIDSNLTNYMNVKRGHILLPVTAQEEKKYHRDHTSKYVDLLYSLKIHVETGPSHM